MKSSQACIFCISADTHAFLPAMGCRATAGFARRLGPTHNGTGRTTGRSADCLFIRPEKYAAKSAGVLCAFGDVLQEDGTPPPFGSKVELTCGNSPLRVVPVDIKGHFMIEVGGSSRPSSLIPDASQSGNSSSSGWNPLGRSSPDPELSFFGQTAGSLANTRLMGCDLRAQLPG